MPQISSTGLKAQCNAVVAVALAGGFGAIAEHMALVAAAAPAVVFSAGHDQLEVHLGLDRLGQGLPEAGPAGAAVVLRLGAEQR